MMMKKTLLSLIVIGFAGMGLSAQTVDSLMAAAESAAPLPLRRLALYSSGVGYFEHRGTLPASAAGGPDGPAIALPFHISAVNDALKSLAVSVAPESGSPGTLAVSVSYPSEETLFRTLRSLKIDLSGGPGIADILQGLKGEELEVTAPNPIRGRILAVEHRLVEHRTGPFDGRSIPQNEIFLSLYTTDGIRVINLNDIGSFAFTEAKINADLGRALDLIMTARDVETRELRVNIPGASRRPVTVSYVIPVPVWKVSYRLDLSGGKPFLQGWAIVDNDGDTDWDNVELSLVTGRPVSFIQDLYSPYRVSRPTLPLAIAGAAEARTYDSALSYGKMAYAEDASVEREEPAQKRYDNRNSAFTQAESAMASADIAYAPRAPAPAPRSSLAGGTMETAQGAGLGDQFEFTLKQPVTLKRRQSAMVPLIEGTVTAEKTLVFSGAQAAAGRTIHPAISAVLTNTTGMKLPAGPITVYDGGAYSGDALIEFFPENEKRIISYGDDLSVSGTRQISGSMNFSAVTVRGGIMTVNSNQRFDSVYTLRNASGEAKHLVVEHPITAGATLAEPAAWSERTGALYRFIRELPAKQEFSFTVREESPRSSQVILSRLPLESMVVYASNEEFPANVKTALAKAADLKRRAETAKTALVELDAQRERLIAEQERIRRNLEAAGNKTPQGQDYLRRMADQDGEIDTLNGQIEAANKNARAAQSEYDAYLMGMSF
ncbi:hypothetical protein AGMMS50267_08550 [Spirochaetia bacterium]|nr:hypothetical protein AGMMS50267_08550 [Spirochaetia bacterium]